MSHRATSTGILASMEPIRKGFKGSSMHMGGYTKHTGPHEAGLALEKFIYLWVSWEQTEYILACREHLDLAGVDVMREHQVKLAGWTGTLCTYARGQVKQQSGRR